MPSSFSFRSSSLSRPVFAASVPKVDLIPADKFAGQSTSTGMFALTVNLCFIVPFHPSIGLSTIPFLWIFPRPFVDPSV